MNQSILKRAAAVLLIAALMATPVFADTIGGAVVHTSDSGLNLRAAPTTDSAVLAEVPDGTFLLVEEAADGWYKVVYNGVSGYVSADFTEFAESLDGVYDFSAATAGTYVNLRAGAGTGFGLVKRLPNLGTGLTVTGVSGDWLRVRDAAGAEGYIRSDLVNYQSAGAAAAQTAAFSTVGEQIAATARQYLGYRYTWGGMSPETGFDCSGFVNYIYKLYGYSMERVAQNIYSYSGTLVGWEDLQPGDVLCFGYGPYSVGHVGIYVGDGQMVHASTYTTGVILTDLAGTGYTSRFVGAKRFV